ncbi:hypothetical protein [Lentzea sp. NPDC004782]|uniref:hypothetical protein n=1 Tax=Lentzea sp. NPDC004782 TaxID=3154458 RepID=UPI0033A494AF
MLRKSITSVVVAFSVFAGTAALVPAAAQAAGIWVYVQSWLARGPEEAAAAKIACHLTASQNYPGRNYDCSGEVPDYVQLWVEY